MSVHRILRHSPVPWAALALAFALIGGCAAKTPAPAVRETVVVEREVAVEKAVTKVVEVEQAARATPAPAAHGEEGAGSPPLAAPYRVNRMIIKNAEMNLLVENTAVGIDGVTQVAIDAFGYVLSSRTWYQDGFQYATITIGVPSDEYENAMRRLRGLASRVLDEQASGTDVSDEYVDLASRLRNLEATEIRIRAFLDQAETVEESLQVNQRLSEITAQIEEIKGRMNYLKDRAAYSTITVHLTPQIPTPTPTPTPTATPTPTPQRWRPGETFASASSVLGEILRVVGDMVIWGTVIVGPFLAPAALVAWLALRFRRKERKPD
jgi:hypothetical protein